MEQARAEIEAMEEAMVVHTAAHAWDEAITATARDEVANIVAELDAAQVKKGKQPEPMQAYQNSKEGWAIFDTRNAEGIGEGRNVEVDGGAPSSNDDRYNEGNSQ